MTPNVPFLTLIDPRAKIKGSRDPLGLQILWTKLGRQLVNNLTTVTTSVRGFSVLLLGLYFSERAIAERHVSPDKQVELFLKFEQLAAYSRVAAKNISGNDYTEDEIRGIQRVKKNLLEKRVLISAAPSAQILANQKTYGLWGLYMVAARNSGLVDSESTRLTNEARAFVMDKYDNPKRLSQNESDRIISFLIKDQWFEPTQKDIKLAQKLAALFGGLTPSERIFYQHHLIECGDSSLQASLWQAMKEATPPDQPFSISDLLALKKQATNQRQDELARRLLQIQVAESVFGPAASTFNFMLARDNQPIERIASEIKRAWGTRVRSIDPEAFAHMMDTLGEQADAETRARLTRIASFLAKGLYKQTLELLIEQNRDVMQSRGGNAWAVLKGRRISVRYKENTGMLPSRAELPLLWTNTYFLNALKTVGHQIDGNT